MRNVPQTIPVRNAGLVILNSYYPMLFERLGLLSEKHFAGETSQVRAGLYLQYLVTGSLSAEESFLPLNKVLCGLPLSKPVTESIAVPEEQKKLIESLLHAAISHWPALGSTSIDGFRGNWLVRNGMLHEQDEKWELTVERKAYDILLYRSPFSFSVIHYPWLKKPLHVNWPY